MLRWIEFIVSTAMGLTIESVRYPKDGKIQVSKHIYPFLLSLPAFPLFFKSCDVYSHYMYVIGREIDDPLLVDQSEVALPHDV
jgi:hypothetical protein